MSYLKASGVGTMRRAYWLVPVLAAVLLLTACGRPLPAASPATKVSQGPTASPGRHFAGGPTGEAGCSPASPIGTPEVPLPTWGPSDLLQRDVMIARAMGQACAMGEKAPRLVDARQVTVAELADTNYVSLGEEATNYGPPSKQVVVVRVAGRFTPYDLPYEVDDTWPRQGIAHTVYDAATGEMLGGGLRTDNPPAGTPPVAR